jgi:hypothetical protein
MTTFIRRHGGPKKVRKPVLLQTSGLWLPCDDKAQVSPDAEAKELGIVRGLMHRPPFGYLQRDLVEVTEGEHKGFWLPV